MEHSTLLTTDFQFALNLIEALRTKNKVSIIELWKNFFKDSIFNRVLEATPEEQAVLQQIFETNDEILMHLWLSNTNEPDQWRDILLPIEHEFPFDIVAINALWLRLTESKKLNDAVDLNTLISDLEGQPYAIKAKKLAQFCLRHDAETELNYDDTINQLPSALWPFFVNWFLQVYLLSPLSFLNEKVNKNREKALQAFNQFHHEHAVKIPLNGTINVAGYRAAYTAKNPKPFMEVFAKQILVPSIEAWDNKFLNTEVKIPTHSKAVLLNHWTEQHVIYRCISPLLTEIMKEGLVGILSGSHTAGQKAKLPQEWQQESISLLEYSKPLSNQNLVEFSALLKAQQLDLLFFPEVGLNYSTRWLSAQRIARVQAVAYGHPITTGSPYMDYFIGGIDIETNPEHYTERLILLPGYGVGSTAPPAPQAKRQRPLQDEFIHIVNLSSFDKYNPELLKAWNTLLNEDADNINLHLYPALTAKRLQKEVSNLENYLLSDQIFLHPLISRQELIDQLEDMDLYLDSYPFGGFNTLIEVLASGCPVITLEGQMAHNRFGAAMIRKLGLPEFLITKNYPEYIAVAKRLIRDSALRLELRAQLQRDFVLNTLCNSDIAHHFKAAVEWMCEQGPRRKDTKLPPVYIEAGEKPRILDATSPFFPSSLN